MTQTARRRSLSWMSLTLIVLATGCDSPIEPGDPQTINVAGNTVVAPGFTNHTITASRRGVATATLRFTTGDLDFFITATACTTGPVAIANNVCTPRVFSDAGTGTSEQLTIGMIEGETAKLWVQNFIGPTGQGYTIEVVVQ